MKTFMRFSALCLALAVLVSCKGTVRISDLDDSDDSPGASFTTYTQEWLLILDYATADIGSIPWESGSLGTPSSTASGSNSGSFSAISPDSKFVYVPNETVAGVFSGYSIDAATGTMTELSGSPFTSPGQNTQHIVYHPSGDFIYMQASNLVQGYAIASDGTPSAIGTPVATATGAFMIAMDPQGEFLYVSHYGSAILNIYRINQSTGALTLTESFVTAAGGTHAIAAHPGGNYVVLGHTSDASLRTYQINRTTGTASLVHSLTSVSGIRFLNMNNSGSMMVLSHSTGIDIFEFNDNNGQFSRVPNSPITSSGGFYYALFSPDDSKILGSNLNSSIHVFNKQNDDSFVLDGSSPVTSPLSDTYFMQFYETTWQE